MLRQKSEIPDNGPSQHEINEKVLIRYPTRKSRIPSKGFVLRANVLDRDLRKHKYLVELKHPKLGNVNKEWIGVENITSVTHQVESRKQEKMHTCKISNTKVQTEIYNTIFTWRYIGSF